MFKHLRNALREWKKDRLLRKIAKQTQGRQKIKAKALKLQAQYEALLK